MPSYFSLYSLTGGEKQPFQGSFALGEGRPAPLLLPALGVSAAATFILDLCRKLQLRYKQLHHV